MVALLPGLTLVAGAAGGSAAPNLPGASSLALACLVAGAVAWLAGQTRLVLVVLALGFVATGWGMGAQAGRRALAPPIREHLDAAFGGFSLASRSPAGAHAPVVSRLRLVEDAARVEGRVRLRGVVEAVSLGGAWRPSGGGVLVSVDGQEAARHYTAWRAGRRIAAPVSYRRPARYENPGVPDLEREAAYGGVALFGSIKSALLVEPIGAAGWLGEEAAKARAAVRRRVAHWLGEAHPVEAAVITAVLIGDRAGLSPEVRERLQAAGTYHVIAISGGNIAVLAALCWWGLALLGAGGRTRAAGTLLVLGLYAVVVAPSPSVWRATSTAAVLLGARVLDHRSAAAQALGVSLALAVGQNPLAVRDVGFLLTFGATGTLLLLAERTPRGAVGWTRTTLLATAAVEVALLPVTAQAFGRVTAAGLLLNLAALPLMSVGQIAGLAVVIGGEVSWVAAPAAWTARMAAGGLLNSARLVDFAPWLAPEVPPPGWPCMAAFYGAAVMTCWGRGVLRLSSAAVAVAALVLIMAGRGSLPPGAPSPWPGGLTVSVFDVGQGDATLVTLPDGTGLLVDAGGSLRGGAGFDVGARILVPALRAAGVRTIRALVLTHGHPDHVGGAPAVLRHLGSRAVWQGVQVDGHGAEAAVRAEAARLGIPVVSLRRGLSWRWAGVDVRVLHPQGTEGGWRAVRNDDSVVLELRYGDVALLLPGDIGALVERDLAAELSPARYRILKVAHHGSRTSTSAQLLGAWRPDLAIISCGRGNPFGHPAPAVLERLRDAGATVLRTDHDGRVQLWTDGREVYYRSVASPAPTRLTPAARPSRAPTRPPGRPASGWRTSVRFPESAVPWHRTGA